MKTVRLLLMPLRQEQDVVECRRRARRLAESCHFDRQDQIRIATAVSEIARNAFRYAREATAEFALGSNGDGSASQQLICTVKDKGPGIPHLENVLAGNYKSTTGMGMGITGARRLMDEVDLKTGPQGTTVRMAKTLPQRKTVTAPQLQELVTEFGKAGPMDPLAEISTQNQELLRTLEEVQTQREELTSINDELRETNRGVVALYDELDTIHRVGRVVASKLDRELLLEAIINATTDISAAEIGVFFYKESGDLEVIRHYVAGPLGSSLRADTVDFPRLLRTAGTDPEILRIDDLEAKDSPPSPLDLHLSLRSYLHVPVCDVDGSMIGALVFGHRNPGAFSERTERILSTVAVQATMALENARLYHDVQSASAAKDQFISVLSHELRTPLNPVFAILSGLEQNAGLSADVHADLVTVRRNLELEARLIDDLLDLTRIIKGQFSLHLAVVDIHSVLHAAMATCNSAAAAPQVQVKWELHAPACHVMGDPARIQQVFWNLMGNAMKFTRAGGGITVRTEAGPGKTIRVFVIDQGRGITAEALRKIFLPFEQGDKSVAAQFGGLGLGLAISQSIARAHKGDITAQSEGPGKGATFCVVLPLTDAPMAPVMTPTTPAANRPKGVRILLVDDHEDSRLTLGKLLTLRGHQVTSAGSCKEAIVEAARRPFDLLISDLGLPDGSGHDLMRTLHASHQLTGIALSGYGMTSDLQRSEEAGFAAHLTKPTNMNALEAAIAKVLQAQKPKA